ncbi:arrestin domain-containing protein 3-like isoform X3 [Festucalex cinctus]
MPAIKSLTMVYDALNEDGTFSEGDPIRGKVTLVVEKPTAVQSFFVKVKGDAHVRWTTRSGNHNHTHSANRRYFKLKQFLIEESANGACLQASGAPMARLSTFLKQSCREVGKSTRLLTKVTSELEPIVQQILCDTCAFLNALRQVAEKDKELGVFSSGKVHMEVTVDRMAYAPGETAVVVAKIRNSSSSDMTPKVRLSQVIVYTASSSTKHENRTINKMAHQIIGPHSEKEVKWAVKIPTNQEPTIKNCEIISLEYILKVYLDISFAFDPEVTFPVIIIPPDLASASQQAVSGPSWGPHSSDFHPAAASAPCYPPSTHRYEGAQPYSVAPPSYPANPSGYAGPPMAWGFNQGISSYGSPSSSRVLHPPPNPTAFYPPTSTFPPPPSAPVAHPGSSAPPGSHPHPSAPSYEPPSYMSTTNFLSQSDEPPPAYSLIFPSSANDESGGNK